MTVTPDQNKPRNVPSPQQASRDGGLSSPLSGNLSLHRHSVNDDGSSVPTGVLGLQDAFHDVDSLTDELNGLIDKAVSWIVRNSQLRHASISVSSNDN